MMPSTTTTPFTVLLARAFWMMVGPGLLFLAAAQIVKTGLGWLTAADLAFGGIVLAMMFARWAEGRSGHAQRADGQPAQPGDVRRYVTWLAVAGLVVWVVANILGNQLLG